MLSRALQAAAGNGISTVAVAEAIDFDGTNDALSRSSLTGNTDSKTLTCSVFFYAASITGTDFLVSFRNNAVGQHFAVKIANNAVYIDGGNASATAILAANTPTSPSSIALNTWNHVLISIDLVNTSNRSIYINDVAQSVTWSTYTNDSIAFSTNADSFRINALSSITGGLQGRLSNVYLDYTYRDLSVTANRRLFVTADLKPAAGQAALNPILYLPMDDPTQPGLNAGTGGDFTLTGVVARSGRGPNQYNAPMSYFTAGDSLTKTTTYNSKTITIAFNARPETASAVVFYVNSGGTKTFIQLRSTEIRVYLYNSAGVVIGLTNIPYTPTLGRNLHFVLSVDMANTSNRHVAVNGSIVSTTWTTYTNDFIDFNGTTTIDDGTNCNIGALWFNTSYIDLSQAANLAKFVTGTGIDAKPVDLGANGELPTGTSPLIYLPMYGNNAGKNYGTGGDFTVNSGPYPGARGPNEFWSGSGLFDNPTQAEGVALTLNNSPDVTGITKTTFAVCFKRRDVDVTDNSVIFNTTSSTNNNFHFSVYFTDTEVLRVGWNGHTVATSSAITDTNWHTLLVSVDSTATVAQVYLDGVSLTSTITLNRTYTQAFTYVGRAVGVSADQCFDGNIGFVYQAHDYIDISQEANRLKFFDAFGYPVNLNQQIENGAIPAAYIYLLFPESNLGANSGTAGNFTNNSVTASALVKA